MCLCLCFYTGQEAIQAFQVSKRVCFGFVVSQLTCVNVHFSGILEVHVLEGRNLVPKDANGMHHTLQVRFMCVCVCATAGLSDPYIVIKYSEEVVFRTKVVRNSLNPQWNECASLAMPTPEEKIIIVSSGGRGGGRGREWREGVEGGREGGRGGRGASKAKISDTLSYAGVLGQGCVLR